MDDLAPQGDAYGSGARDAAIAGHTEEALVRVVVPVIGVDPIDSPAGQANVAAADQLGEEIAGRLEREVARVLPK